MAKRSFVLAGCAAALLALPSAAFADEIVHFTNGAEMTVRSHVVDKDMVKLDLGGNSFIAFPMSMVDKVVSAGRDVFLNPAFHPANQAIAGGAAAGGPGSSNTVAGGVGDTTIRGGGASVGFTPQVNSRNGAGVMLGEVADTMPQARTGSEIDGAIVNKRRVYNPAFPAPPGGLPQVINPPSAPKTPPRMSVTIPKQDPPPPPPPTDGGSQDTPQGDPDPQDPPTP